MLLVVLGTLLHRPLRADELGGAVVGMPARIEQLVLPGPELEVKPLDDRRKPIVLRIIKTYPHGTAFRYDLTYYGLEAGDFDLRDYLRRKNGTSAGDLPALKVTIHSTLPAGQVLPSDLELQPSPALGGYRLLLIAGGVLWVLGLLALLFVRRRKKAVARDAVPVTLADRLRPLVEGAVAGKLTLAQQADLERMLLAYWRTQLHLEKARPAEAFATLRRHPEAGPLLESLEAWLHRPGDPGQVDLAALLRPYQNVRANSI